MIGLEKPPFDGGVDALRAYLFRLTEQLQWALETLERLTTGGNSNDAETR